MNTLSRRTSRNHKSIFTLRVTLLTIPRSSHALPTLVRPYLRNSAVDGARLIVKPIRGRYEQKVRSGNAYRAWSGQGDVFEDTPVAFYFEGDIEEQASNRKDVEVDQESQRWGDHHPSLEVS